MQKYNNQGQLVALWKNPTALHSTELKLFLDLIQKCVVHKWDTHTDGYAGHTLNNQYSKDVVCGAREQG